MFKNYTALYKLEFDKKVVAQTSYFLKHVLSPLIFGIAIYLFIRKGDTIVENFFNWSFSLNKNIQHLPIVNFLGGVVPDFCWLYALLCSQTLIWGQKDQIPILVILFLYILPVLSELLQYMHVIDGTGDWYDIIAYFSAILVHQKLHTTKAKFL